jgi:hypothetical protein
MKRAIWAGLLAGIVVACAEPAAEMVGEMMQVAGHGMLDGGLAGAGGANAMADAGKLDAGKLDAAVADAMVDAAHMLIDAGHWLNDGGPPSDAGAQEPSGDGLPRGHWVLRDSHGQALNVLALAWRGAGYQARFTNNAGDCVYIQWFSSREINLAYQLSSGTIATADHCIGGVDSGASWRDPVVQSRVVFHDSSCQTPASTSSLATVQIGGSYYYTDGAPMHVASYYTWDQTTQICAPYAPTAGADLWLFKPMPALVVNLMPDPPYTFEVVY